MWPWSHAAFGYVWYSLAVRGTLRRAPTDVPAVLAVVATQLPDLIDKPLAWSLGITSTGYGPAHSLFVGVPVVVLTAAWLWRTVRPEMGIALAFGYVSHLAGDLIFQYHSDGRLVAAVVLWPVAPAAKESTGGLLEHFVYFLRKYVHAVVTGEATTYAFLTIGMIVLVFGLWLFDGAPGTRFLTDPLFWRRKRRR